MEMEGRGEGRGGKAKKKKKYSSRVRCRVCTRLERPSTGTDVSVRWGKQGCQRGGKERLNGWAKCPQRCSTEGAFGCAEKGQRVLGGAQTAGRCCFCAGGQAGRRAPLGSELEKEWQWGRERDHRKGVESP